MTDISSFFHSKQIKPEWEFSTQDLVWQIAMSPHDTILIETRDQTKKSTKYCCLHAQTGMPLWSEREFDEPWWIGIETIYEHWIVFHGYTRPDMPEHRGIRIVDLLTGREIWKNDELTYWFMYAQKLYAYKYLFENRKGYELDVDTGTILEDYSDRLEYLHELKNASNQQASERPQEIYFGELLTQKPNESGPGAFIYKLIGNQVLNDCIEYLIRNNIVLITYYEKEQDDQQTKFRNVFMVYESNRKKMLFKDILAHGIDAPNPGSFFVKGDFVYYIKNQHTIIALNPWKS